jgi:hypothetical protein
MVGNPGVEPGSSWSQARWVTVSLAPGVEKAGIEPARQRLQGAPGALPVIPRGRRALIPLP